MNVTLMESPRHKARREYDAYRALIDAGKATDVDLELAAGYRQMAMGHKIIHVGNEILKAGIDSLGRPKFAICRADAPWVYCIPGHSWKLVQGLLFSTVDRWNGYCGRENKSIFIPPKFCPDGSIVAWDVARSRTIYRQQVKAQVPLIPASIRPRANLKNYHILWEANWEAPPRDPLLLRRVGRLLFVFLAAWDLTDLERAILRGME